MAVKRAKILLGGKVQGVFFRDFAKQNANRLGIVGYAKNNKDGTLEIVAQGEERKLEEFVRLCKKGPIFAKVESATVANESIADVGEYEYFDIRYS
jgi:acylphosphatase